MLPSCPILNTHVRPHNLLLYFCRGPQGASPNATSSTGASPLGVAIDGLSVFFDEPLLSMLLPHGPDGRPPPLCLQRPPNPAPSRAYPPPVGSMDDIRAECIPLIAIWNGFSSQRNQWTKTMLQAEGVITRQMLGAWMDHEHRTISVLKRSPSFARWVGLVERAGMAQSRSPHAAVEIPDEVRRIPTDATQRMIGEAFGSILREMEKAPGFDLRQAISEAGGGVQGGGVELTMRDAGGLLHMMAFDGASASLEAIVDRVTKVAVDSSYGTGLTGRDLAAALLDGMTVGDRLGRTPLHHMAIGYGGDSLFEMWMAQVERLADAAGQPWESSAVFLSGLPRDSRSRTPMDYLEHRLRDLKHTPQPLATNDFELREMEAPTSSGGWAFSSYGASELETDPPRRCDFTVLDARDMDNATLQKAFEERLYLRLPVMIKGDVSEALRTRWSRKRFLDRFGPRPVTVGRIPYANNFGLGAEEMTMAQYVALIEETSGAATRPAEPPYLFGSVQISLNYLEKALRPTASITRCASSHRKCEATAQTSLESFNTSMW